MSKPLLLVDIDGVLNAFSDVGRPTIEFEREERVATSQQWGGGASFWIRVPKGTSKRIKRLSEHFEMHWASMWMGDCHGCIGKPLLGIEEEWPFIKFDGVINNWPREVPKDHEGRVTYKLIYVANYVGDRPFAWIDDDLGQDAAEWAAQRLESGIPTMLVRPKTQIGMTDKHVEVLTEFASRVNGS